MSTRTAEAAAKTAKPAAKKAVPAPSADQADALRALAKGVRVRVYLAANGVRRTQLVDKAGAPSAGRAPRRAVVESLLKAGWVEGAGSDETGTTFATTAAGRAALRRAAK